MGLSCCGFFLLLFSCSLGLLLCVVRRGDGFQLEGAVVGSGCESLSILGVSGLILSHSSSLFSGLTVLCMGVFVVVFLGLPATNGRAWG